MGSREGGTYGRAVVSRSKATTDDAMLGRLPMKGSTAAGANVARGGSAMVNHATRAEARSERLWRAAGRCECPGVGCDVATQGATLAPTSGS